jgi:probable phosphoglycerate mutase
MTEFLLIRHGETAWNRELRFQGQIDVPLNDMGVLQAQRLQRRFEDALTAWQVEGRMPTRLISSDLVRAQQTAQAVAQALGQTCVIEAGLREQCFGVFEGLRAADIQEQHSVAWQQWLKFDAHYAVEAAESTQVFYDRVMAAMAQLAQQYAGERVVVVTHGGVLDMIWRHAQALSLHGPRMCEIPNAGLSQVAWRDSKFHILDWADTAHLADMPPQPHYQQSALSAPQAHTKA